MGLPFVEPEPIVALEFADDARFGFKGESAIE